MTPVPIQEIRYEESSLMRGRLSQERAGAVTCAVLWGGIEAGKQIRCGSSLPSARV